MLYKHIIFLDDNNFVVSIESIEKDEEIPTNGILIEESNSLAFIPPLEKTWGVLTVGGAWIPCYSYNIETQTFSIRPQADIDADVAAAPPPQPSQLDRIESQVTYTAMMTDTLIEEEE